MAAPATTNPVLPPLAATMAMKTPAVTAMAGAQTINNQQSTKSTVTAMMTATMMTMDTKGTAVAAEAR